MAADVLSQLLEASWRGIPFPTAMVNTKGGHNVVAHRRVDRDGWRVENTGRNSNVYTFKVPFINTIVKGQNETWQNLYPATYKKMLTALEDRSSGPFVHPSFGARTCKVESFNDTIDPDFRGGPTILVTLWETVDDGNAVALSTASALSIAATAAFDLDAFLLPLNPPPSTGTPGGISLTAFIKGLGAIADEFNLFKMQILGQIGKVVNAFDKLGEAFGVEPGFSDNTQRLISALHAYSFQVLQQAKPMSFYVVPKPSTVAAIANRVQSSVTDILSLNPGLAASPIVRATTVVRYYSP